MENILSFFGALVSGIFAFIAWFVNNDLKKYEIKQAQLGSILSKRLETYPELWFIASDFKQKLERDHLGDEDIDEILKSLAHDLREHRIKAGIFYTGKVDSATNKTIEHLGYMLEPDEYSKFSGRTVARTLNSLMEAVKEDIGASSKTAFYK
ncbi:MAG: hypothetical protein ACTHWH_05815 [Marinobacter sp.]